MDVTHTTYINTGPKGSNMLTLFVLNKYITMHGSLIVTGQVIGDAVGI